MMREGMAYGGMPFPDICFRVPDVYLYYVSDVINVWLLLPLYAPPLEFWN